MKSKLLPSGRSLQVKPALKRLQQHMKTTTIRIGRAKAGPDNYIVTASEAIERDIFFCLACHRQVRVHKQRSKNGPRDHFEHLKRGNCRLMTRNKT